MQQVEELFFHGTPIRCPYNFPIYEDGDNNPIVRCKHRKRFETWHALKTHASTYMEHHDEDVAETHQDLMDKILDLERHHPAIAARHALRFY